jgi:transaldolase
MNRLKQLASHGQSVWLDYIQRGFVTGGGLERLIREDGLCGVTSNPAIFEKAIAGSTDYDQSIRMLAGQLHAPEDVYQALAIEDIRMAADLFRPVYDATEGADGFVSLEVSPHLAHDTEGSVASGRELWRLVNRPNICIKIPGTREGLPAIERLIADGINVNVTLLFGLPRYHEVAEAYIRGMEARASGGQRVDRVASVASFFLSRIDVLLDPMIQGIIEAGGARAEEAAGLQGEVAIASAKVAYEMYKELFGRERFAALAAKGARPQRLLWASTSTKNPAYSDVKYVEPLIGPNTINTMPPDTVDAYRDHGNPASRLEQDVDRARAVLAALAGAGIDIDAITQQLEDEGVDKFNRPFDSLMAALTKKMAQVAANA